MAAFCASVVFVFVLTPALPAAPGDVLAAPDATSGDGPSMAGGVLLSVLAATAVPPALPAAFVTDDMVATTQNEMTNAKP